MWAAWIVAAIALTGAAFMLRVLVALLGEGAPSVCYWVVPVRTEMLREVVGAWGGNYVSAKYVEDDCQTAQYNCGEYYDELLENGNYAKQECSSGLIALNVRPVSGGLGWRSIHWRRGYVFREHRL
jgi:ABC-type anion transport system duplicated permease subunit